MSTSDRIKILETEIKRHKELYYAGRPEISDHKYDVLEDELRSLDPENYVLDMVGTVVIDKEKVAHDKKMLSLHKTYSVDELMNWVDDKEVISTLKIDGMSCSLIYKKGALKVAKTRGDGKFGENIFAKVKWIDSIPKRIDTDQDEVEVRGEILCKESDFYHLAKEMEQEGLDRPTSQRNIVAGLIGRKDRIDFCRFLSFVAFDVIAESSSIKKEADKYQYLKMLGFDNPLYEVHKGKKSIEEELERARDFMVNGEYQIDGIVFSYNELSLHEELGETAHHPRYKLAFKFQGESKETTIEKIEWSVSRNGILTPVANVAPVELSGATISRVTLHNYGVVDTYKLKKGDKIEIIRSGEVIPKFLSVIDSSSNQFEIPQICPSCGSEVFIEDIRIVCKNPYCPAVVKETILNFVKKIGIEDLSTKRLEEMINLKLVSNIPGLYKLTIHDLLKMDKVKDKLATKLIDSIQKSKETDLVTFLSSLGISGGAYNKCEKVVNAGFNTVEKIKNLSVEKLSQLESFAEKSSTEFVGSVREKYQLIDDLINIGFRFKRQENTREQTVTGFKFCITGTLSRKRGDIEKDIKSAGGAVVSSVSKNTDYLITNDTESTSSKFVKAQELKIPILNEEKLDELLAGKK